MISLSLNPQHTVVYLEPVAPQGGIHTALIASGGFYENPSYAILSVPLSVQAAQDIRLALKGYDVEISPETAQYLGSLADGRESVTPEILFKARLEDHWVINASFVPIIDSPSWHAIQNQDPEIRSLGEGYYIASPQAYKRLSETFSRWTGATPQDSPKAASSSHREAPLDIFGSNSVRQSPLPIDNFPPVPEEANAAETPYELPRPTPLTSLPPFADYDGSLISLRKVDISLFDYVKNHKPRNNKKKSTSKTKSFAEQLKDFGLANAYDVIHHFPLRYIDRSRPQLISSLLPGDEATIIGTILSVSYYDRIKKYCKFVIRDSSHASIEVTFFRQPWLPSLFRVGDEVMLHGKYEPFKGRPQLSSPTIDKIGDTRSELLMIPVYPQSEKQGITTWDVLSLVREVLSRCVAPLLVDPLEADTDFISRADAYRDIHIPSSSAAFDQAHERLVYEELLRLQVFIQKQKQDVQQRVGLIQDGGSGAIVSQWREEWSFAATNAQQRAMDTIADDMTSPHPMHRLLQGDVGSGKSLVAAYALLSSVDSGYQAALLAPTEILAEQLYQGLLADTFSFAEKIGLEIAFLGGKSTAAQKRAVKEKLANNSLNIVVGTHSLLTEDVVFANLGMVVVDEQHRFGVEQRTALRRARLDGATPDMLIMSATPIPRSSAMVLYGDLDLTVLDEMPPGRIPIDTVWLPYNAEAALSDRSLSMWDDVMTELDLGHQVYIVASLVEDNENIAAASVEAAYETLRSGILSRYAVGMVHGKQSRSDREEQMREFAANRIQVLVATTVIEVGVNVPNATRILVMNPGRFGVAQLHQIRGRVGRSALPSRCYLVGEAGTANAEFRLGALVESTDGFYLSEKDLELRGEGTLFSSAQSGVSDLKIASLRNDLSILEDVRLTAQQLITEGSTSEGYRIFSSEAEELYGIQSIKS